MGHADEPHSLCRATVLDVEGGRPGCDWGGGLVTLGWLATGCCEAVGMLSIGCYGSSMEDSYRVLANLLTPR